jgi:RNA polymerase sigma-70 factor (ECF subfamily)
MAATGTYIGSEVRIREEGVQEMQDVLSRYGATFYRKAYHYLGNAADAEDAVQDAILSAYKNLDQFKGEAQMSTWLTSIVINCARMHLRKRPRQTPISLDERFEGEERDYSLSERLADNRPSPEDKFRKSEFHEHLMQFVAELPPSLRKTFELRDLDELTTRETAQALGVPVGTVKARISRARAKLRRLISRAVGRRRGPTLTYSASRVVKKRQHKSRVPDEWSALLA